MRMPQPIYEAEDTQAPLQVTAAQSCDSCSRKSSEPIGIYISSYPHILCSSPPFTPTHLHASASSPRPAYTRPTLSAALLHVIQSPPPTSYNACVPTAHRWRSTTQLSWKACLYVDRALEYAYLLVCKCVCMCVERGLAAWTDGSGGEVVGEVGKAEIRFSGRLAGAKWGCCGRRGSLGTREIRGRQARGSRARLWEVVLAVRLESYILRL